MPELLVFGAVGALEGFAVIPVYVWVHAFVARALGAERGAGRRTAATAVTSIVALSLDLLPLTYAATLVFPAAASPNVTLRGEVWISAWLGALALSGVVWIVRKRKET
jgi:hypothetical protein